MRKKTPPVPTSSMPTWETLEEFMRAKLQATMQSVLEEELTTFLGCGKSERRAGVDVAPVYRNGYGKVRKLALSCGTIEFQRPRARNLDERFESQVLPLFARQSRDVSALLPELYLHGLSKGDFELALRGLLGEGATLSPASIERLRDMPGYSPELNPDELVNQDVKTNALGRRRPGNLVEMIGDTRAYLRSTQKQPTIVRRYFQGRHVRYAA